MASIEYRLPQERKIVTAFPGPKSAALAQRRKAVVGAGVASTLPVYVADADGGVVVDVDGNSLIDLGAGIAVTTVGASNPAVVAAVQDQVGHFTHTCFMIAPYEGYIEVAEKLAELTPGDHDKRSVLFNSGAEAVENAVKIARHATGRSAVVVFDHAYHGRTNLTMALTSKSMPYKSGFGPFAPEVYRAPMSYPFREGLNADGSAVTGAQAAARAISVIEKQVGAGNLAAILIEPIQGEGGFIVPAEGFLPALADWARENGVVFIADEVQAGFTRTGAWFASEHEGIVPDLIDAVHPGGLGGTYGGNPVACAAALASIEQMETLDLNARARDIERIVFERLNALRTEIGIIGEVRGRGAMLAIELVLPGGREPNPEATKAVAAAALEAGVIVLTCGTYGNVIRLLPPLVISDDLLSEALTVLEDALRAVAQGN
jgi:4-aminobutyrate aminotransferase/(S)-3-amino-2-methylpropionate transaminase